MKKQSPTSHHDLSAKPTPTARAKITSKRPPATVAFDENIRYKGKLLWFNPRSGYGFIRCPQLDCDLFAPGDSFRGSKHQRYCWLPDNVEVEFQVVTDTPHLRATDITSIGGKSLTRTKFSKNSRVRMERGPSPHLSQRPQQSTTIAMPKHHNSQNSPRKDSEAGTMRDNNDGLAGNRQSLPIK